MAASGLAAPQFQGDSSLARILQEQRFNMGDGKFGSAFAQEDGTISKEESTGGNERIGQYSYIDDTGKTITVKYSAGVNGFRSVLFLNLVFSLLVPGMSFRYSFCILLFALCGECDV